MKITGADHPATLTSLNNVGVAYQAAGKLQQAIALLEQARTAAGGVNVRCGKARHDYATAQQPANAYQAAGNRARRPSHCSSKRRPASKSGNFSISMPDALMCKAIAAFTAANQLDKAESWRRKWMAFVRQQEGPASPAYAASWPHSDSTSPTTKMDRRRADPARVLVRFARRQEANDWRTFNTMSMLGGALLGQKNYAGAEPLLVTATRA